MGAKRKSSPTLTNSKPLDDHRRGKGLKRDGNEEMPFLTSLPVGKRGREPNQPRGSRTGAWGRRTSPKKKKITCLEKKKGKTWGTRQER